MQEIYFRFSLVVVVIWLSGSALAFNERSCFKLSLVIVLEWVTVFEFNSRSRKLISGQLSWCCTNEDRITRSSL